MITLYPSSWLLNMFRFISALEETNKAVVGLGGVRNLGKTTAIIQIWRHLAGLQAEEDGLRTLRVALFRDDFSTIERNVIQSMSQWYEWHTTGKAYDQVFHGAKLGLAAKSLRQAPEIVTMEKTYNWLDILSGGQAKWDGTYTRINYVGYSSNKPNFATKLRGAEYDSVWINEAPTHPYEVYAQASSIYGRPEKSANRSTILCDYNFPSPISDNSEENKENVGYQWVKNEFEGTGISRLGRDTFRYSIHLDSPYKFIADKDASRLTADPANGVYYREYRGEKGFLIENDSFPEQVPYKKRPFSQYDTFLDKPDHVVQTDLLGEFGNDSTGEAVYYMFNKDKHIEPYLIDLPSERKLTDRKLILTIDFGFQYPAALLGYVDDMNNLKIIQEFVKEKTALRDMLAWDLIPYLQEHFPYHYNLNQIVIIGDPTSGNSSNYINSATPMNVLTGVTDEDGREDGDGIRYHFEAYHSPCGNQIKYRLDSSYTYLNREGGVKIQQETCPTLIKALSKEYVWGNNGKPKKVQNDIYTGVIDAYQYMCAYLYAGGEFKVERQSTYLTKHIKNFYRKKNKNNNTRRTSNV